MIDAFPLAICTVTMQPIVWYTTVTKDYINFEEGRLIPVTFRLVVLIAVKSVR